MKQAPIAMLVMMFATWVAEAFAQGGGENARRQEFELASDVFDKRGVPAAEPSTLASP